MRSCFGTNDGGDACVRLFREFRGVDRRSKMLELWANTATKNVQLFFPYQVYNASVEMPELAFDREKSGLKWGHENTYRTLLPKSFIQNLAIKLLMK